MPNPFRRGLVLMLLGFGIFNLLAGALGVVFWLIAGEWEPYLPIIVILAFAAWPIAYQIWKRYQPYE